MALTLESIAPETARRESAVAGGHEDRVCGVAEMVNMWGGSEVETRGGESVGEGFEGQCRCIVSMSQETRDNATEGVAGEPEVRGGVFVSDRLVDLPRGGVVIRRTA